MKHFRRVLFFALMITALFLIELLVWTELFLPMISTPFERAFLFSLSTLSLGLLIWHLLRIHTKKPNPIRVFITFALAGFFIHLLCAMVLKSALLWIPGFFEYEKIICRSFFLLALAFNILGIYSALGGPRLKKTLIPLPKELARLNGFKIAQISDLHIGPLIRHGYVSKVVKRIKMLNADLIVLTGDIGDSDPTFFSGDAEPLRELSAPHGVYYVLGNHEYYWDAKDWVEVFRSLGLRPLLNEGELIADGKIWLGGVTDPDGPHFIPSHTPYPEKALNRNQAKNAYKILLAHQPKNCFAAQKAGFHLMLSGHTHGGQFFPFNLLVGFFNPYSKALNQHLDMLVYVSRGTGFWGPALRLGVAAEITLLELKA